MGSLSDYYAVYCSEIVIAKSQMQKHLFDIAQIAMNIFSVYSVMYADFTECALYVESTAASIVRSVVCAFSFSGM